MWGRLWAARRRGGDAGVTAVEYGLLAGLVALVAIPGLFFLTSSLSGAYDSTTAADPGTCVGACTPQQAIDTVPQQGVVLVNTDGGTTPQTINFPQPADGQVGTPATLTATADSGLTVTLTSQTKTVCTISGFTATYVAEGTCTIVASQGGNTVYAAAAPVTRTFTVDPSSGLLSQTITWTAPLTGLVGTPATLVATATSGLTVGFSSSTTGVCTVAGSTVTYHAVGTCTITASQGGGSGWDAAPDVANTWAVGQGSQTISFSSPPTTGDVGKPATVSATATSGLAVTFSSGSSTVCTVTAAGDVTYLTEGSCIVRANQAGDSNWAAAAQVTTTIAVRDVPSVPRSLNATAPGSLAAGQINLNWNTPSSNGGTAVTDYVVQYKLPAAGSWTTFADGTGTASTTTVTGLTSNTSYQLRVAAVNAVGTGPFTSAVTQTSSK